MISEIERFNYPEGYYLNMHLKEEKKQQQINTAGTINSGNEFKTDYVSTYVRM